MTHRASVDLKSAYLSNEFGRDYAMRVFELTEAELEAIVGRYTRGKRKGLLRGLLTWKHCIRGGWYVTGHGDWDGRTSGHVVKPGLRWDHEIVDPYKSGPNGNPKVLWSMTFKEWGWIPGETREQYETRNRGRFCA